MQTRSCASSASRSSRDARSVSRHVTVSAVWRAGLLIVAALASVARADDPRETFGFKKRPPPEPPLDCSDGKAFGCVTATDPLDEASSPYALSTWLPSSYLLRLPVADATHDAVAHYGLGASRDDAGPSFAGATGLENRWTIEGAPADGLRTGAADSRVPLLFLDGILVRAGGFSARDRVSTGGAIDARLRSGTATHEVDVRGWAGYSMPAPHLPIAPATYFPRRGQLRLGPEATIAAVATGPGGELLGGRAWYAVGLAAELASTRFTWKSGTVRDVDGDGMVDGVPGVVPTDRIDEYSQTPVTWRVPMMLRGGLDRGAHHVDVSLVGAIGTDVFYLYNSTLQAAGVDGTSFVGDAIATWRGRWTNTRARAQLAWHRTMRREHARDPDAAGIPQLLSAYVPDTLADDPELAAACSDADPASDRYPAVPNCPVPIGWFASGGAGPLSDVTGDRPSLTVDVAHRLGNNVVRVGATAEDTRLVTQTRFTGNSQIRSLFDGHIAERRFADPSAICNLDLSLPCPTVNTSELRWRTRYTAAYIEDTWRAAPNIAVDGGLRWELMWVGTVLHFSNQLAPRLGASWEPTFTQGRARLWASMGRSYALLPAGLGRTLVQRERTVDHVTSMFGEARVVDTGAVVPVAAGVEPIAQDELTTGVQAAIARNVRATLWLQGRWLRRGLDTTGSAFDNPGRHGGTPATRDTGLVAAEVATAPTTKLVLRAGYMYGRTIGSWSGAFDPREGAVLYAGSDYDASSVNLLGRLPSDVGHRTYIEAERGGTLGPVKLAFAMRLTAGSGRPRSAVADSDNGIIYLIPRDSAGRGPLVTQANIRIAARWQSLDITLDLFNVFQRETATSVDEIYAFGAVRPIDRGTPSDLVFLKTETGADATRRATYATATSHQSPLAFVLGIRHAF